MLDPQVRCVVGIDVAKRGHVVCALDVPGGTVRQPPFKIEATAAGYAQLRERLTRWGRPTSWRSASRPRAACGSPCTTP
jgi:transposase